MLEKMALRAKDSILRKMRLRSMRKYGAEALAQIHDISQSSGKPVWLEYGTLLGAYREHGFIAHDDDIDVSMYAGDYDPAFERALFDKGFKLLRQFRVVDVAHGGRRCVTEVTLKYRMVYIDIFFKFRDGDRTYNYLWKQSDGHRNVWLAYRDYYTYGGFRTINFVGISFLVPEEAEKFLQAKYGDDFMTPQPGWQPRKKTYLPLDEAYGEVVGGWIG